MTSQIFLETAMIYFLIWSITAKNCLSLQLVPFAVVSKKKRTKVQINIIINLLKIKTKNFNKLTASSSRNKVNIYERCHRKNLGKIWHFNTGSSMKRCKIKNHETEFQITERENF